MEDNPSSSHLIVIGGTKGIGRCLTLSAASEFGSVTAVSRKPPNDPEGFPRNVFFAQADITDKGQMQEALQSAVGQRGPVSGLAFFQRFRGADQAWDGNLASTLTSTRNAIEFLAQKFHPTLGGSIVILSSIASHAVADEQDEGYHAAKAGLLGLSRYYAFKLGPRGIRVNCVAPGVLLKEESKHFFTENKALHELYCKVTPLRRMGTAEEVAAVVRFLLSREASFVTGQEITVDGGAGLQWQESMARMLIPIDGLA